jgi:PAS domain-containing protein
VYCSPTFTALTGYDPSQILGRNCRFLQSPDGEVVKGSKRKYTDNVAVAHLKRMLNAGKECQASLINYRRGGIPFINLVTVVPIPWEGTDIVYHVGFQVDLVEQPNAILRNMRDGSYQVNYTVANPPQAPLRPAGREGGVPGISEEMSEIMGKRTSVAGFGQGEEGGKMEWLKMALENADGEWSWHSLGLD